ncbi:MAG: hypothetical protein U5K99_08480 [Anaerolineales bacterium]|nr:hypothetical protein [Anaerolineales bacterium]
MKKTILLFDMDGVLLDPRGYHRALQETVRLTGLALGYQEPHLPRETIRAFEAAGITSEWDSGAVCLALMLTMGWKAGLPLEVPCRLNPQHAISHDLPVPDWAEFLTRLNTHDRPASPLEKALALLFQDLSPPQQETIAGLIENAHTPAESPTHRTFQELVLGSSVYQATYSHQPALSTPGFLTKYDQPSLQPAQTQALKEWLTVEGNRAAIITNRPSQPPPPLWGTPEAELGASLVGLDRLPLIGYGQMRWTANRLELSRKDCYKPSPVHALSALLAAEGIDPQTALLAAGRLTHRGQSGSIWKTLDQTQVFVFEDTPPGLKSVQKAKSLLKSQNVNLNVSLIGISAGGKKRLALEKTGAVVYPHLARALQEEVGIC